MEIQSRHILIIFATVVLFYFWWSSSEEKKPIELEVAVEEIQEEEVEEEIVEAEPVEKNAQEIKPVLEVPQTAKSPTAKYPNLDDSFVPFDEEGNRYVMQVTTAGPHLVYHGDVLLGATKDLPQMLKNKVIKQGKARKWSNGVIPYYIDENLPNYEQVMEALGYMNLQTNVSFVEREEQVDFVHITVGDQDCYSFAGRIGGKQEIFLTPSCSVREILHELMHTLGFFHEQNREDRDQYLKILWENIHEDNRLQFKKLPDDFVDLVGRPFDYNSIMLYSSFTFALSPQEPAMLTADEDVIPESRSLLSEEDINRVNLAYPKYQ